ncbi:Polyphosphate kinase [Thalassoporum mexicanum PCC 7367]|uniref:polyphosphate kinase 1 n=1 Tax=Thalassoporum mexicanum TaxID=3457544 RepID=UPI00029FA942|nr:polyphosphate kinase 1 [Pseudanabaena sp. PCC 7367]AFY71592.1 Polyphosphate kinase [Pseudanabaena sp. PCC 7367]
MARARRTIDQKAATDAAVQESAENAIVEKETIASESKPNGKASTSKSAQKKSESSESSDHAAAIEAAKIEKANRQEQAFTFFNREISWIAFNERVLDEGIDDRTPLLERVKFFSIFNSNLDEFFMVRVARSKRKINLGLDIYTDDGLTQPEQLSAIRKALLPLVKKEHQFFEKHLRQELKAANIHILDYKDLNQKQKNSLTEYYKENIFPVLTPLAVDPGHPFPYISNLSLNLAVVVADRQTKEKHYARVKVPSSINRFVTVPGSDGQYIFVPLEQVIAHNLGSLFRGMEIKEYYAFRITRDAELDIEEDEADDLISALQAELRKQRFGSVVRMEIAADTPNYIRSKLIEQMCIQEDDVYDIDGLLCLRDLMSIASLPLPEYKDQPWRSVTHPRLKTEDGDGYQPDIFSVIKAGDFLVHHPYQSFTTSVQRFIEEAAADEQVLAIKQTLYRTSGDSPIVHALVRAAENGKQVAVLVELKARFDEANNILWAKKLENSGVHVVYGVRNLKTHTKTALVVRREGDHIVRYVHIGTGNYNPKTARFYSDLGLLSCRKELGEDLSELFNHLTGYSHQTEYRKLLVAPVTMRDRFEQIIRREIEHQTGGYQSRMIVKMNSLVDPRIIKLLYEASAAGIQIDLIIRGICCLRPGVKNLSENIRVVSIIGRFLEHSRIFYFSNGGKEEVYIGSADWMPRNLNSRVEVITPLEDPAIIEELKHILDATLSDKRQAWDCQPDGSYVQRKPAKGEPDMGSQHYFMAQARPDFESKDLD